jgi:23S rRNA-/tRNA-specific pseudouridylate synthase
VLVALTREAMTRLSACLAAGTVTRLYTARVHGRVVAPPGWSDLRDPLREASHAPKRMEVAAGGLAAHTRLRVVEPAGPDTTVRLEAVTGRQHQLRVHLAHRGHPIVADPLYGPPGSASGAMQLLADELVLPAAACAEPAQLTVRSALPLPAGVRAS